MTPRTLVGCGILRKEVEMLIAKNGWPVSCHFACSSLHVDFDRLKCSLEAQLERYRAEDPVVLYGTCHPHMEGILAEHGARRTAGQNCIEMLLGAERFQRELAEGAFFLLEDWARTWDHILGLALGTDRRIWPEIFRSHHRYIQAIRTPCSLDFSERAAAFAEAVDLPLRWCDCGLLHLEGVLRCLLLSEAAE